MRSFCIAGSARPASRRRWAERADHPAVLDGRRRRHRRDRRVSRGRAVGRRNGRKRGGGIDPAWLRQSGGPRREKCSWPATIGLRTTRVSCAPSCARRGARRAGCRRWPRGSPRPSCCRGPNASTCRPRIPTAHTDRALTGRSAIDASGEGRSLPRLLEFFDKAANFRGAGRRSGWRCDGSGGASVLSHRPLPCQSRPNRRRSVRRIGEDRKRAAAPDPRGVVHRRDVAWY